MQMSGPSPRALSVTLQPGFEAGISAASAGHYTAGKPDQSQGSTQGLGWAPCSQIALQSTGSGHDSQLYQK